MSGGAKALEQLDPDFAHAIADAVFMDGSSCGVKFIQDAIGRVGIDPTIKVDGGMGAQTLEALKKANDDPTLRHELQSRIARNRMDDKPRTQGEIDRISRTRPGAWKR